MYAWGGIYNMVCKLVRESYMYIGRSVNHAEYYSSNLSKCFITTNGACAVKGEGVGGVGIPLNMTFTGLFCTRHTVTIFN